MEYFPPFVTFTLILITALALLVVLKIVRLPTLPAYFIAGLCVGPNGLGILDSSEAAHFIGELGIVLLLFTIGLKFNLSSLHSIRNYVFILGSAQVLLTTIAVALAAWYFVDSIFIASLIGFVAAMSSTAIVSQLLLESNAVASPVGRRSIAVLLFQDLIVIPLIIIYSDKGGEHSLMVTTALLVVKIIAVLLIVILVAPALMRYWLNWASRFGDKELFIINIVAIISLFSMLTGVFGLSYVLGAFLAGILIAETMHRYRVEQIVEPFRQIFLGFFFITLGILIIPGALIENAGIIFALAGVLLVIKFPIVYVCIRLAKSYQVTAARTAFLLFGTGEFGFVLLAVAKQSNILSNELFQLLVPVNMLAMIVVPMLWPYSDRLARKFFPQDWLRNAKRLKNNIDRTRRLRDHIIICGFGRTGQVVSSVLRTIGAKQFIVIEEDYVILEAAGNAEQVIYGSGDRSDSLLAAGILRAKALIVAYHEPVSSILTIQNARQLNPSLYIIAKAVSNQQKKALRKAGADEVLVEAHETGFALVEKSVRQLMEESVWMLEHTLAGVRSGSNKLFLGEYAGTEENANEENIHLMGYQITGDKKLALKDITDNVEIVAWRRDGADININAADSSDMLLHVNDQLVLLGSYQALEATKNLLDTS